MTDRAVFRLVHDRARSLAVDAVTRAEDGTIVTVGPPTRNNLQNAALHAALADIAEQVEWRGQRFNVVTWKRLCAASWLREEGEQPELIPALDGNGFDIIFEHTSQMTVAQLSSLIDWCHAFGAQHGVLFQGQAA